MKFNSIAKPKRAPTCCEVCGSSERVLKEINLDNESYIACMDAIACVAVASGIEDAKEIFELL